MPITYYLLWFFTFSCPTFKKLVKISLSANFVELLLLLLKSYKIQVKIINCTNLQIQLFIFRSLGPGSRQIFMFSFHMSMMINPWIFKICGKLQKQNKKLDWVMPGFKEETIFLFWITISCAVVQWFQWTQYSSTRWPRQSGAEKVKALCIGINEMFKKQYFADKLSEHLKHDNKQNMETDWFVTGYEMHAIWYIFSKIICF